MVFLVTAQKITVSYRNTEEVNPPVITLPSCCCTCSVCFIFLEEKALNFGLHFLFLLRKIKALIVNGDFRAFVDTGSVYFLTESRNWVEEGGAKRKKKAVIMVVLVQHFCVVAGKSQALCGSENLSC